PDIGREHQVLRRARTRAVHPHRQEGRVLDPDPNLLRGRYHIGLAVRVLAENGGEQSDEALARDPRAFVPPRAVAKNFEADIAAEGWVPMFDWRRLFGRSRAQTGAIGDTSVAQPLERGEQLFQG